MLLAERTKGVSALSIVEAGELVARGASTARKRSLSPFCRRPQGDKRPRVCPRPAGPEPEPVSEPASQPALPPMSELVLPPAMVGIVEKWGPHESRDTLDDPMLEPKVPAFPPSTSPFVGRLLGWDDVEMEEVEASCLDEDSSMDMDSCLESVLDQQLALEGNLCSVETTGASKPASFWHVMVGDSRSAKEDQAPYDDQMDLEADDGMPQAEAVGWKHVQDDRVSPWQQGIKAPTDANAEPTEGDS